MDHGPPVTDAKAVLVCWKMWEAHRILSHVLSGCLPEGYLPAMGFIVTKALLSQSQVIGLEWFRC